jgi:Zn finger protein HypA/HybF involved in hydrogenase expression
MKEACETCHSAKGWKPAQISSKFDHSKYGFALSGAHAGTPCLSCHGSLDFAQQKTQCASCHEDPHRGELGAECARCHGARSFLERGPMTRAHQATRFPLTGSHAAVECEACHRRVAQGHLQFVGTQAECESCHRDLYASAKNPDHAGGGFPLQCASCHNTLAWNTARFDHARTRFPLSGAHRTTACQSCHGDGVYAGKSAACASCHIAEYNGTADPNHAASGFSTDCATCHTTTAWAGATFDHARTQFPLTGAHASAACQSCHGDNVYAGKSTACASCHLTDFNGTTNPNHASAGFSTACATCHTTVTWTGATFDHDAAFFPIYSGTHNNRWDQCADCHTNPANFAAFTCLSCHPHDDRTETDGHHSGTSGYRYDSAACYDCHPRGRH